MRGSWVRVCAAATVAVGVMSSLAPATAHAQDKKRFQTIGKSGSDADRAEAKKLMCRNILDWVLGDEYDPSCIEGERLEKLVDTVGHVIRNESWVAQNAKKPDGPYRLSADVFKSQAKEQVYRALDLESMFAQRSVVVTVDMPEETGAGSAKSVGGKWPFHDQKELRHLIKEMSSSYLDAHRFRLASAKMDAKKADEAAAAMGASPSEAALVGFAESNQADSVLDIHCNVQFTAYDKDMEGGIYGEFRIRNCEVKLLNKATKEWEAKVQIKSSSDIRDLSEMTFDEDGNLTIAQPQIQRTHNADEFAENYFKAIGKACGKALVRRLFKKHFAGQADTGAPAAGAPAAGGEAKGTGFRKPRPGLDNYTVHMRGFNDDEVEEIVNKIRELGPADGFSDIKCDYAKSKDAKYQMLFVGDEFESKIKQYLEAANIKDRAKVEKTTNNFIQILKKGQ